MIGFNGFIQATAGLTPTFGDKSVGQANRIEGQTDSGDATSPVDETASSFLEWVQTLMDGRMPASTDGEDVFVRPGSGDEPTLPAPDQLLAMITEAPDQQMDQQMDRPPAVQSDPQTGQAGNLDNGKNPLPPEIIKAVIAPEMAAATNDSSTVGQTPPPADGQPLQATISGTPAPIGQGDDNPLIEHSLQMDDEISALLKGIEKEKIPLSTGDESKNSIDRFVQAVQGRSPVGSELLEKTIEPAASPQQPMAEQFKNLPKDQTKDPALMAMNSTNQKTSSSQDDTANYQGRDEHRSTRSIALAELNEDELPNNPSLDSMKSKVSDTAQSRPVFQDSLKAVAADLSTTMAVKPTAGQAAALTRLEESGPRVFQTTVMDQIVDKAAMRSLNGRSEIQIRLKPEFLGNVQMNIATDKDQLMVRILTDLPVVKEIIETHLHHLKTELANQGLTIDKFDIAVNPDADHQSSRDQFAQMFKKNSFQNGRRQPQEQNPETMNQGDGNPSGDDRPKRDGVNYFA